VRVAWRARPARRRPEEATRLFGACEAARAPAFTERDTRWFGAIRDELAATRGPERFEVLLAEGARVSRPAAVELARLALAPTDGLELDGAAPADGAAAMP
jgi:hypothetical protein